MANKFKEGTKSQANTLIEALKKFAKYDEKNVFQGFESTGYDGLVIWRTFNSLPSLVRFSDETPDEVQSGFVNQAIMSAAAKHRLNSGAVSEEIKQFEQAYLNQAKSTYYLLTSVSIKYFDGLTPISLGKTKITFFKSQPRGFSQEACNAKELLHPSTPPSDYTWVKIKVEARCTTSAAQEALYALDFIRGLWNLYFDRGITIFSSSGRRKSINKIVLGPVHTLHKKNGELATDHGQFWWEPSFMKASPAENIEGNYKRIKTFERDIRKSIDACYYSDKIQKVVVHYARALDETDPHTVLMQLWSILEGATAKQEQENYDAVVARTLRFYHNQELNRASLERLRIERNSYVHQGTSNTSTNDSISELRMYVSQLIYFMALTCKEFKTLNRYRKFLDLPRDANALAEKKQELERQKEEIDDMLELCSLHNSLFKSNP
jgi:hypothetical protein